MTRTLHLCGAGNPEGVRLALRVNEAGSRWARIVLLDDDSNRHGERRLGVEVVGPFEFLATADPGRDEAVNLVARTIPGRRGAAERIAGFGIPFGGLVSPDVDLLGAEVASDLIAYRNATIGPEVTMGGGCVVFMGAAVGHGCLVGRHCVIAANAVLNARVRLGDGVYVGTNATVLPEIEVGDGATIGAGATVLDDVPAGATVVGALSGVLQGVLKVEDRPGVEWTPDQTEERLAEIWRQVLDTPELTRDQSFFELGGTSLLALRIVDRVEAAFGERLSPVDVLRFPTVGRLASRLVPERGAGMSI